MKLEKKSAQNLLYIAYDTLYQLANAMNREYFIYSCVKLDAMCINFKSLMFAAEDGQKEIYYQIKDLIQKELKDFFDTHDLFLVEQYDKRTKSSN